VKILQITAPGRSVIRQIERPRPGPGEVLVRVNAVTTCPQWDLHLKHNEPMFPGHRFHYPYTPGQPGHEATGVIEESGEGVEGLAPGDRICVWRDPGHHVPGCYAQYVVRRAEDVIRVPAGIEDEALAPLELAMCMGTVFRMLKAMGAVADRPFGVSGLGPAGLIAVQMAKAEGAKEVYGFDPLPQRRELASCIGADMCFDPHSNLSRQFPARPDPCLLETAVDCVGTRESVQFLMDRTADAVALFGVQREDYIYSPRHNSLRLCGYQGHSRESAEYALRLISEGKLNLAPLVTHRMPLEHYCEAVELLERREAIKVCFLPWKS